MMRHTVFALVLVAALICLSFATKGCAGGKVATYRLAMFSEDVTIPIGHACMGGGRLPAKGIVDLLFAKGLVLLGPGRPIVVVAVDWCQLNNDSYERWRTVLAEAAQTTPQRVLLAAVHQHDAVGFRALHPIEKRVAGLSDGCRIHYEPVAVGIQEEPGLIGVAVPAGRVAALCSEHDLVFVAKARAEEHVSRAPLAHSCSGETPIGLGR